MCSVLSMTSNELLPALPEENLLRNVYLQKVRLWAFLQHREKPSASLAHSSECKHLIFRFKSNEVLSMFHDD